jgi:tripartite ATP-independent transporter DctM subunit
VTAIAIVLAILLVCGLPIAFAFGLASIVGLWFEQLPMLNLVSKIFAGLDSFVLLAAPFYIIAGELMNRGGISDRLIRFCTLMVGRIRGGTAYAVIVASVLFAGISGTAVADIAALGQIFINSMPKEGYSKPFAAALVTAGSIIGPIIPPSVIMVIYAAVADLSVLKLFLAGVVPGLLLGVACGAVVFIQGVRGELPLVATSMSVARAERGKTIREGILVLSLPAFIVFGTLSGVFTPTEAGGIAVVYAIFLGMVVFKHLDFNGLMRAFRSAARLTAALFLLIATVEVVNFVLIIAGIEDWTKGLVSVFKNQPTLFLLACVLAFLVIGLALDAGPALLLLAPVLLPVSRQMGIDDIHFSMVMIVSCTMGLISPPVGICLFVACKIGDMTLSALWRELRWFFYAECLAILALVCFPILSTGLPNYFYK